MSEISLKKNILLNGVRTSLNIISPILILPYVLRILGPKGIGDYNYYNSIITYIILLTNFGISIHGIKEIGKCKNNKKKRTEKLKSLLSFNLLLVLISYLGLFIYIKIGNVDIEAMSILKMLSITIFFNAIGVEWFFVGIEKQEYITYRSIIIKIIYMISILLFVKTENDLNIYVLINITSILLTSVLNFIYLKKYIDIRCSFKLLFVKNVKKMYMIFFINITLNYFGIVDVIYLGYITNTRNVAVYMLSLKIIKIILVIITSASMVVLPRLSYYLENGNKEKYDKIIKITFDMIFFISLPVIIYINNFAFEVINLFAGPKYLEAVSIFQILSLIILLVSINNTIVFQILYPNKKEGVILKSFLVGILINIVLNYYLVSTFQSKGIALSYLISTIAIIFMQLLAGKEFISKKFFSENIWKYIFSSALMHLFIKFCSNIYNVKSNYIAIFILIIISFVVYILCLILIKEDEVINILMRRKKWKKN